MMHFVWPLVLLLLPLPWLIRRFFPAVQIAEKSALKVPFLDDFKVAETEIIMRAQKPWALWVAIFSWCLLVLASSRPQWLGDPIEQGISGRDLMLAVDLSGSMQAQDFIVNGEMVDRLTATKVVASAFIEKRIGDRIGLILFGTNAYLQTPLTFDRKTVQILLNEAALGLAGESTAIGDAIGLAIKRLKSEKASSRVLILLTDGANTAGNVTPLKAAELAAEHQLKIYTIGIGADEMIVKSFFGSRKVNPSQDLDEKTLTAIAEKTGGQYFRARDTAALEKIYQILDKLEPIEKDKQYFRPRSELFFWPLGAALILAFLISILRLKTR
jgi:Ca-activated chloride channel family protein